MPKGSSEAANRRTENTTTKRTNNDVQNMAQKNENRATRISPKTEINTCAPKG